MAPSLRSLLALGALAVPAALALPQGSTSTTAPSNTDPSTTIVATSTAKSAGLNKAAKKAGKMFFGTAADIPGTAEDEDVYYLRAFNNAKDFGEATPANAMKVRHKYLS